MCFWLKSSVGTGVNSRYTGFNVIEFLWSKLLKDDNVRKPI